jgi:hypothetical protein
MVILYRGGTKKMTKSNSKLHWTSYFILSGLFILFTYFALLTITPSFDPLYEFADRYKIPFESARIIAGQFGYTKLVSIVCLIVFGGLIVITKNKRKLNLILCIIGSSMIMLCFLYSAIVTYSITKSFACLWNFSYFYLYQLSIVFLFIFACFKEWIIPKIISLSVFLLAYLLYIFILNPLGNNKFNILYGFIWVIVITVAIVLIMHIGIYKSTFSNKALQEGINND